LKTAILTSIPSLVTHGDVQRQYEQQRRCIDSWLKAGHLPLSVNYEQDIPLLSRLYPDVTFHPTYRPRFEISGEVLTFVHDAILSGLESEFDRLAFCNPDLFINYQTDFASLLSADIHLAYARRRRLGTPRTDGDASISTHAFDYVNMSKEFASTLPDSIFAFGYPWWEYWLILESIKTYSPIELILANGELLTATSKPDTSNLQTSNHRLTIYFAIHCLSKIANIYERRTSNLHKIAGSLTNAIDVNMDHLSGTHYSLFKVLASQVGEFIQASSTRQIVGENDRTTPC
jgi:hypothetical protein